MVGLISRGNLLATGTEIPLHTKSRRQVIVVSDRGPDHGNHRIVSLRTNRRLLTILHCIWVSIVATPAFILTHFVANRSFGGCNKDKKEVGEDGR
jgi:hypothetical protein